MAKFRGIALATLLGATALFAPAQDTLAQGDYPNQRVTIVVPFSAGSITDGLARVLADKLSDVWKQQVIEIGRAHV